MMLVIPGESSTGENIMLRAEHDEYVLGMTNANKNAGTDSENEVIEKEFEAEYVSSSVNNLNRL